MKNRSTVSVVFAWIALVILNPTIIVMYLKKDWSSGKCWAIGTGAMLVAIFVFGVISSIGESPPAKSDADVRQANLEEAYEKATVTAQAEAKLARQVRLTATQLYNEREANATRFDDQYKGKRLIVSGEVVGIDNGMVRLGTEQVYGSSTSLSDFLTVNLEDLPRGVQASVNKGQYFTASCEVSNYIIGSIMMKDCQAVR